MFQASVKSTDYDFVAKFCRAVGISRQQFIVDAVNWQANNMEEVPLTSASNRTKSITIVSRSDEFNKALTQLDSLTGGEFTEQKLCMYSIHNYIKMNKDNGTFDYQAEKVKVPDSIRITLSDEIRDWMKDQYGGFSDAVRHCVNLAHMDGDLPPIEGNYRKTSGGGSQASIYLKADVKDKIKDLILSHGGSANNIIKQSIQLARSVDDIF